MAKTWAFPLLFMGKLSENGVFLWMKPAAYVYSESYMLVLPGKLYFFPLFYFSNLVESSLASQNKICTIDQGVHVRKKGLGFDIRATSVRVHLRKFNLFSWAKVDLYFWTQETKPCCTLTFLLQPEDQGGKYDDESWRNSEDKRAMTFDFRHVKSGVYNKVFYLNYHTVHYEKHPKEGRCQ